MGGKIHSKYKTDEGIFMDIVGEVLSSDSQFHIVAKFISKYHLLHFGVISRKNSLS